jgi:hypothetical protein
VFLSDQLLDLINDERRNRQSPDPEEVRKQRRQAAAHGRRTISNFLRGLPPERWATYESRYFPPVIGTLFEMQNGRRIIHLLIRRAQSTAEEDLYLQLEDTQGHYFSSTFEEIVHSSVDDSKVVPVGEPEGERFRVTGTRYRHQVLKDSSRVKGWLPLVLVITWRTRGGQAEPLLQLRSLQNAARELDRLSHLSGHVLDDDRGQLREFGLRDEPSLKAARRRVQVETGGEDGGTPRPMQTSTYLHPDKENLFFFVYSCEFPEGFQPPWQSEMHPVSVSELLAVRENQTLRIALALSESPPSRGKARADAFEIVSVNLTLHGHAELGRKLTSAAARGIAGLARLLPEIRDVEEQTRQTWPGLDHEIALKGLSGLQYREFFSLLMPFYRSVGVPGAGHYLNLIHDDEQMRSAAERLAELYHDEGVMDSIIAEV